MALERVDVNDCPDPLQIALHRGRYDFTLAKLKPGQRVLEIGTGAGTFTKELLPKCGSYVGVEYDHDACVETRKKAGGKAEILEADARNLPFRENEFSYVICLEVLEHLGDFAAGVRNIHRCITPEGTAVISVPFRRVGGKSDSNPYHIYEPGENELVSLFQELFEKVDVYYQYFQETCWMTLARKFHLRKLLGMDRIYADLTAGLPLATERIQISPEPKGLKITLMVVACQKK